MTDQTDATSDIAEEQNHVNHCLSMVLHHEEARQIAEVIERILADRNEDIDPPEES